MQEQLATDVLPARLRELRGQARQLDDDVAADLLE